MRAAHAIVLAGGSGRRLAALTGGVPKQFCAFGGRRTLLQETLARLAPEAPPDRTTVVVRDVHLELAREQLRGFPGVTILAQPDDCGTAPGLLWPLVRLDPDATVIVTPSDHGVRDARAYRRGLSAASRAIGGASAVLLGVEAREPRTDFGWIVPGAETAPGVRRVETFVEKPAPAAASALLARGGLYSTMVVVARACALLALFERARPGLAALMQPLGALPPGARDLHLGRAYALMPPLDFSRDILSPARDLAVVRWPAEVGWTDLGTPERLEEWLAAAPEPQAV